MFGAALIDVILPMADGLPERLSAGAEVADFGCGSGHAINVLAQAYPASRFTGIDFSEEGLGVGTDEARRLGLTNASFIARDVARFDAGRRLRRRHRLRRHHTTRPSRRACWRTSTARCGRRRLPDGRHQGVEQARGQRRRAVRSVPLHRLDDALP